MNSALCCRRGKIPVIHGLDIGHISGDMRGQACSLHLIKDLGLPRRDKKTQKNILEL